MHVALDQNWM